MLKQFYDTWYAPNNAILVIAGDVDPQATLATVKSLYESIPTRVVPARPSVTLQPVKPESFTLDSDLPYVLTLTAYRMPGSDDPDFAAAQILSDVLASERADIYALGVQGKALQATFDNVSSFPEASLAAAIGVLPVGADVKTFSATLQSVVATYARNGVPEDLVDAAKRAEIASAEFNRNSVDQLASTWSDALANEGRNSPDDDIAALRKVTLDDVNRVAKTYLDPAKAVTANLIPKPSGKAVSSKGFGGGETLTSQPTKPVELPDWARARLAQLNVPPSTLAPTDATLPNGLRLIVQRETASDTVTVLGGIEHSNPLQTPAGKDGVDAVLAELFSYGTTSLDRLAFHKALDDIAAQETAGTSFTLHVLKADFDRGVQLLADNELNPALPASDFAIVRQQTIQSLKGELQSPGYFVRRAIAHDLLPPNDPDLREATPKTVASITLGDVKNFHSAVYRPDMTTIVVIGNITADEAKASIEKYFGTWTARGPKPPTQLPRIPPNRPAATVVPNSSRVQDDTSLVETVPIRRNDPAYYALQLGDHVLGGGFYATRLYRDLRQIAGLVYNVSNTLAAGKTRSQYAVNFGSDPQNVSKARALVTRDLRAMQTTDVGPAELEQAKAILLRQLPLGEASEDAVAAGLAGNAENGLPLDERHRAAEIYARLSAAQVRAAFARDIRPNGFVQVVEGPNPS